MKKPLKLALGEAIKSGDLSAEDALRQLKVCASGGGSAGGGGGFFRFNLLVSNAHTSTGCHFITMVSKKQIKISDRAGCIEAILNAQINLMMGVFNSNPSFKFGMVEGVLEYGQELAELFSDPLKTLDALRVLLIELSKDPSLLGKLFFDEFDNIEGNFYSLIGELSQISEADSLSEKSRLYRSAGK